MTRRTVVTDTAVCLAISSARLRGNERIIDNPPAVSHPKARIQFHATFDFFQRKMSCGSCDSASHSPDSLLCFMVLYYTTWNANWYESKTESKTVRPELFLLDTNRQKYHSTRLEKPIDTPTKPIQKACKGSSSPPFGTPLTIPILTHQFRSR